MKMHFVLSDRLTLHNIPGNKYFTFLQIYNQT